MNKYGLFAFAAQFAPRLFRVSRRTWIVVGVGLLALFGLLIWVAVALIGWFFGQAQGWVGAAPEATRRVVAQAEHVVPGAREKLGDLVPGFKPAAPQRDVSGSDLGPVVRYPGFTRTYWNRESERVTIGYQGQADYAKVIDHYAGGFAANGYVRNVQTATLSAETLVFTKDEERFSIKIEKLPTGVVSVYIETSQRRI